MAALTRRQVLTATGGGLAAIAVAGAVDSALPGLLRARLGMPGVGQATAFGRVTILRAHREHRTGAPTGPHHGRAAPADTANDHLAPQHLPWSDYVRVDLAVENSTRRPVLLSPGQFRLRVGSSGPTVSLYDAGDRVVALAAGSTLTTWVGYLAPSDQSAFGIEYTEAGARAPHTFEIVPEVLA
jgi:hypothetical protein